MIGSLSLLVDESFLMKLTAGPRFDMSSSM